MIIGYVLYGYDNDSFMYVDAKDLPLCKECGYKLDYDYVNPEFKIKRKNYDFSYTYDNCCIVSLKFKEFCLREKYSGVEFKKLNLESNFFLLKVNNTVNFATVENGIKFENLCNTCGYYESIVAPGPTFLKDISEPIKDGFYRTDVVFGSGNEKNPLIIIGTETNKKLKREKFKGLSLEEIVVVARNNKPDNDSQ